MSLKRTVPGSAGLPVAFAATGVLLLISYLGTAFGPLLLGGGFTLAAAIAAGVSRRRVAWLLLGAGVLGMLTLQGVTWRESVKSDVQPFTHHFADYELKVPAGAACTPAADSPAGVAFTLPHPALRGGCAALKWGITVRVLSADEGARVIGEIPAGGYTDPGEGHETVLQSLPLSPVERDMAVIFPGAARPLRAAGPTAWHACTPDDCRVLFRFRSTLVNAQWSPVETGMDLREVTNLLRERLERWSG